MDASFTFQPDGVHPNDAGHWFIAQQLIRAFGDDTAAAAADPKAMLSALGAADGILPLVRERVRLLRDAYVGQAGHKRPGVPAGLIVPEAELEGREIGVKIALLLAR